MAAVVGLSLVTQSAQAVVRVQDIAYTNLKSIGMNTTLVGDSNSAGIAVIEISGLSDNCQGVFFDANADTQAYATLLTAVAMKKTINIQYDAAIPSPWGNPAWCSLKTIVLKLN
jgi:hypothetical protein